MHGHRTAVVLLAGPLALALLPAKQMCALEDHQQYQRASYSLSVESYKLPDVTLVDMTGASVSLASVLNHRGPVLLQFIFTTCPTICPVMSATIATAQDKLRPKLKALRIISITIDPEHDTPARLREYAREFKAGPQWLFLTGREEDIVAVQEAFDAYRGSKMHHRPLTFLRASPEKPWVRVDGLMSAAELVAECERLVGR